MTKRLTKKQIAITDIWFALARLKIIQKNMREEQPDPRPELDRWHGEAIADIYRLVNQLRGCAS